MMLKLSSLVATALVSLSLYAYADSFQESYGKKDAHKVFNSLTTLVKSKSSAQNNIITDKDESTLVMPKIIKHVVVPKKRNIKKTPKRTIQKIIKKTRKNKKTYLNQMTSAPTGSTRNYAKEQTTVTTQASQKKKVRKWNSKYVRYPMPFQKLSKKDQNMHHRMRRELDRDVYILEDFDDVEFLSKENGNDVVKTHVKNYW